jgi:small subunit ribosomal protein S20
LRAGATTLSTGFSRASSIPVLTSLALENKKTGLKKIKEILVANHASAKKRARQNETRRLRNRAIRSRMRSAIKSFREAVDSGKSETKKEDLEKSYKSVVSVIQKTASKGVIPAKRASRVISRLALAMNRKAS